MEAISIRFTVGQLCQALETTPSSRNFVEGEQILNSGHLITFGVTNQSSSNLEVYGLCLQTSALTSLPHEVKGLFIINEDKFLKVQGDFCCTCKAGSSGRCKHITAILLECTRSDLSKAEKISRTDLKCYWSKKKAIALEKYQPTKVCDIPCIKEKLDKEKLDAKTLQLKELSDEDIENLRKLACDLLPSSAFAQQRARSCNGPATTLHDVEVLNGGIMKILSNCENSLIMMEIKTLPVLNAKHCCQVTYQSIIENLDILRCCQESKHSHKKWIAERQYRITGSRCYGLFTYSKNDWETKALKYFWPKSFTNKFVEYGVAYENEARSCFTEITGKAVVQTGFIISKENPWLGYSPDGIILNEDGEPNELLEIKCPFKGKEVTALELLDSCHFITKQEGEIRLKKKHAYYGQIQFGMALLNIEKCHFIIYATYDRSLVDVVVDYCPTFAYDMFKILKYNYFNNMIHVVCENKKPHELK